MSLISELFNTKNIESTMSSYITEWPYIPNYRYTLITPSFPHPSTYLNTKSFINNITNNKFNKTEDVQELEDNLVITLLIPGFDKSEIEIFVEDNILNIKASTTKDTQIAKFTKTEKNYTYNIPKEYNSDTITANLKNGILTITINKIETKKNTIEIK